MVDATGRSVSVDLASSEVILVGKLINVNSGEAVLADATTGQKRLIAGQQSPNGFLSFGDEIPAGSGMTMLFGASGKEYTLYLAAGETADFGGSAYAAASGDVAATGVAGNEIGVFKNSVDNSGGSQSVEIKVVLK